MSLESYLQAAPKAELHVHLEGAIQPPTALALAKRNNISLPVENEAELRQHFAYRDFDHFIETFIMVTGCLKTRALFRRVDLCYTTSMKAYSQDLRQRVLRAVDQGTTQAEIAKTFAVSTATIKRYLRQRRESGHVLPKAIPGRPARKGAALQASLREQLATHPDATREEHC